MQHAVNGCNSDLLLNSATFIVMPITMFHVPDTCTYVYAWPRGCVGWQLSLVHFFFLNNSS